MTLARLTFYLVGPDGTDVGSVSVHDSPGVQNLLAEIRDRWADVDEIRLDLPDGSHASWPVARDS